MDSTYVLAALGAALVLAIACLWLYLTGARALRRSREETRRLEERSAGLITEAEQRAEKTIREAKEETRGLQREAENNLRQQRHELNRLQRRLEQREQAIDARFAQVDQIRQQAESERKELERQRAEVGQLLAQQRAELERISALKSEEAKQALLAAIEKEIRLEAGKLIRQIEEEARLEGERRAREIIVDAIQKCAVAQVGESTVAVVPLPNDDMKGRIIGREGRNIRHFEHLTGVDLIIDDTPEAVVISAFDPKRREIARLALDMLVSDGRIHPARIEEMVEKATEEYDKRVREAAEAALLQTGISGLSQELASMLGSLKFRTSYSQNVLDHSIEVALLAGTMAGELGLNTGLARRCGLLHDIGKAASAEYEGTHAAIGAQFLERGREPREIIAAAATHHETHPDGVYAVLIQTADAISASRPGSRRESLEAYIQRLESLEQLADSFEGVEKTYAIQAGREIRVIVKPAEVDDVVAARLARDIAAKIESELQYPGQIRVVVTRETRCVEYAR